jgi:hypothetical protein
MTAVLPHYFTGPENKQVSTLVLGGQLVEATTQVAGTSDFTVKPAAVASVRVLGVAGKDANVIATQTGAPNAYGQPLIDISVLDDYTAIYYGGVDIFVWYAGAVIEGNLLIVGASGGSLGTVITAGVAPAADQVVGRCTQPGGVAAGQLVANTLIGAGTYFLGRARIF